MDDTARMRKCQDRMAVCVLLYPNEPLYVRLRDEYAERAERAYLTQVSTKKAEE